MWWYVQKDKKNGPVELAELGYLLQRGAIQSVTLVWREGMTEWLPLEQVEELSSLTATLPPPLPPKADKKAISYELSRRWPRFFARIFDTWWEILLVSFVLGAVFGRYSAAFVEWINSPGSGHLFGIICLPLVLFFDAIVYRLIGNTPGKALLGLRVEAMDGRRLTFWEYVKRNLSIWVSGFALGIPLLNLITMAKQHSRLGEGRQTSYDEPTGFRVYANPIGFVRKAFFVAAFIGLFAVMAILTSMENESQRVALKQSYSGDFVWQNPVTRVEAKIESRWKPPS